MTEPVDTFGSYGTGLTSPGNDAFEVTPDDDNDLPKIPRNLYIGTSGDLKVTTRYRTVVTYKNVPVGDFPRRVRRVWATGTTAADIIADY